MYELGYRICTESWQKAVAWRLAGALDDSAWRRVRKRRRGLCPELAALAKEIEDSTELLGKVAGSACVAVARRRGLSPLVGRIAQTIVTKSVPKIGEEVTAALARRLRVIGIWVCVSTDEPLERCPCFIDLAARGSRR